MVVRPSARVLKFGSKVDELAAQSAEIVPVVRKTSTAPSFNRKTTD